MLETSDGRITLPNIPLKRSVYVLYSYVVVGQEFTRLEFLIISSYLNDFTEAEAIINAGLQDFNTLLGMQDESSYLSSAQAYVSMTSHWVVVIIKALVNKAPRSRF